MPELDAHKVSITSEYDLVCQERHENTGARLLEMSDEEAGRWVKWLVRRSVDSAATDDRVAG